MTLSQNELKEINGGTFPIDGILAALKTLQDIQDAIDNLNNPPSCNH